MHTFKEIREKIKIPAYNIRFTYREETASSEAIERIELFEGTLLLVQSKINFILPGKCPNGIILVF